MARIVCPNCGEIIEVDPSSVEDLTRQLRDELFAHDLEERLVELGHRHEAELAAARAQEQQEAQRLLDTVRIEKAELKAQLDASAREAALAVERAQSEAQAEKAQLEARLTASAQETDLAVQRTRAEAAQERAALQHQLDEERSQAVEREAQARARAQEREAALAAEVAQLKAQLSAQEQTLQAQAQADVLRATSELERSCGELESRLAVEQANSKKAQADLREEMARREGELAQRAEQRLQAKDEQIEQYKAEVERLRDYRVRLSTKLVGESLERHCEAEFNRIRMQAYPRASFEKDNEAVGGTKGDFIFRDFDDEGNELLSIMFEMKNEEELSQDARRKRNEDHFRKLDADRTKKHCEYAVLVSTLEPDNDFYNAGIADVSWHHPKMFVVRPQCFTTIIGLLKAAALAAHPYKVQLERARREELDVTRFEERVATIVGSIENDYQRASKNYERAEADIDAIIKKLEDLKKQLHTATTWFGAAQKQGEKLTVKRLTRGNATMKAAFAEAGEPHEAQADASEPLDPDELE